MTFLQNSISRPFNSLTLNIFGSLALVIGSVCAVPADATILTFQVAGADARLGDGQILPQTYGDNVTGSPDADGDRYGFGTEGTTPNVTVSYGAAGEAPVFRPETSTTFVYYNGNANEANTVGDTTTITTVLTAANGFNVDLYGFDLAADFATFRINGFTITNLATSAVLFTSGVIGLQAGVRDSFDFSAAPYSGSQLQIQIDTNFDGASFGGSISPGITDIRFGQTPTGVTPPPVGGVPEPAAWAMLVIGFGAIGGTMRRRAPVVAA